MKLVVTHEQPDFDALASLALARLAHPGAEAALDSNLPEAVRAFVHLYRDRLELLEADEVALDDVDELIVVDTSDPARIGRFAELLDRVPVTVYDHHPRDATSIHAGRGISEQLGATVTLLARHLRASRIAVPPALASLALLAIHEDTGNLSLDHTTPDDYRAAAWLLESGASLALVREFGGEALGAERRRLLEAALEQAREVELAGARLVVAAFEHPEYVRGAATVCSRLQELHGADGALLVTRMEQKTLVFARAHRVVDAGAALEEAFSGGGHPGAAFARTELPPDEALERALEALGRHGRPLPTARDIMSRPVRTVPEDATVREAQRLLARFGHTGAPVLGADGRIRGVVSRRDLDRALAHDLGRSEISGFMTREVVTAGPEATLAELEELVERHNIGRLPIVDETGLLGIVTRSDLLAARHPQGQEAEARQVLQRLPSEAQRVLAAAAGLLDSGSSLYVVGGTVRDALLGRSLTDLDLALEGSPVPELLERLSRELGGEVSRHAAFDTGSLLLPSGLTVDLAGTREESYPHPGALPEVTSSSIRRDLARRDFSINAMAVRAHPLPAELIDPFGGLADLQRGTLRLLHPLSLVEDPTRILRGARLAARLGFRLEEGDRQQLPQALDGEILGRVSRERLRAELELSLAEPRVAPNIRLLEELGALAPIFGLSADPALLERLDELRSESAVPDLSYLLALLLASPEESADAHVADFHWPRRLLAARRRLARAQAGEPPSEAELEAADPAERCVYAALGGEAEARLRTLERDPGRRKLRGSDVLDLGLLPGPQVGEVLADVASARQRGQVKSFEEELELARQRVEELRGGEARE